MSHFKTEEIVIEKTRKNSERTLIVYNDDFNTFDHVIETLKELCGHTTEQAEQCTLLIHYKGKCDVKRGSAKQLKPIFEGLGERGLTAAIEK
jgi:ATP-dependent Clp protease adaptor protein ClpS